MRCSSRTPMRIRLWVGELSAGWSDASEVGGGGRRDAPTDEGVALEETLRVLLVELEELTSRTTDLGEDEGDPPDLVLVLEAVLTSELELGVKARRLERTAGDLWVRRRAGSALSSWCTLVGCIGRGGADTRCVRQRGGERRVRGTGRWAVDEAPRECLRPPWTHSSKSRPFCNLARSACAADPPPLGAPPFFARPA